MKDWRPTGGQSVPAFDHYMASGVAKSFVKELHKVMSIRYPECNGELSRVDKNNGLLNNEGIKHELKKIRAEHRLILDKVDEIKQENEKLKDDVKLLKYDIKKLKDASVSENPTLDLPSSIG